MTTYQNNDLIKTSEVVSIVPFSRSTLLKLIKQGKFPQPFKPSERVHLWHKSDVIQWLSDNVGGANYAK